MSDHAAKSHKELRCFCSRSPLLAVYGIDRTGKLFIHIKVYKQDRIYADVVLRGGDISMKCRDCYRWYNVAIRGQTPNLIETQRPIELQNPGESHPG